MGTISASDAVLTITVPPIIPSPIQLQGFGTDDVFDIPSIKSVETMMGVDGILSGGFVYVEIKQTITLQADSLSNQAVFDAWWAQMQGSKSVYVASGLIKLPSVATKYILTNGYLTGYKPAPAAKRVLHARTFEITWGSIGPGPA
jgi:hypothetical protein